MKQFFKEYLKKYLPLPLISFLRGVQYFYYAHKPFHHKVAQRGELKSNLRFMVSGNKFMELVRDVELLKDRHSHEDLIYSIDYINNFFRDIETYKSFSDSIQDKRCLEIGSGPIGALGLMPWINKRIIIDPLLNEFKKFQLNYFGKTFFTDDIEAHSQNAELFIPHLEHSIDGFIITRNALDHCEDPWVILENISRYARSGCRLLLWTDLWHMDCVGNEHRNIIKDRSIFEKKLIELGFRIDNTFSDVRADKSTIEYGCVATKII